MKILVVTNLYPPHHIGGYELGCRDIVEQLRSRGHDVGVLTSTFRNPQASASTPEEPGVERRLHFNAEKDSPRLSQRRESCFFAEKLRQIKPQVIYFFNQAGLARWLPIQARALGYPIAFFLSDTTFVSWKVAAWLAGSASRNDLIRSLLGDTFLVKGWPVIRYAPCHFASDFLRQVAMQSGIPFSIGHSIIAHWGIERSQFPLLLREPRPLQRLLYVGQLIPQKGVHTAMAAVEILARESVFSGSSLTIAGGGMNPGYEQKLHDQAAQPGLAGKVQFLGRVPRTDLPKVYAEHDALIFPSEWDEPFAITPLEAMASGLPVIGTLTGGSPELFRNRETAMTFQAGDAADCARAIRELGGNDELRGRITQTAREVVLKNHTLDVMLDAIEESLKKIAAG